MPGDYSEELVELVARALPIDFDDETTIVEILPPQEGRHSRLIWGDPRRVARAILDALSSAGRLVPEGSYVETRFVVEGEDDDGGWISYADDADQAQKLVQQWGGAIGTRSVITTPSVPWTPAEPAQEER